MYCCVRAEIKGTGFVLIYAEKERQWFTRARCGLFLSLPALMLISFLCLPSCTHCPRALWMVWVSSLLPTFSSHGPCHSSFSNFVLPHHATTAESCSSSRVAHGLFLFARLLILGSRPTSSDHNSINMSIKKVAGGWVQAADNWMDLGLEIKSPTRKHVLPLCPVQPSACASWDSWPAMLQHKGCGPTAISCVRKGVHPP